MTYFKCIVIVVCVIYAKQYSSYANYSYINSLLTLDRQLKVPVGHFFKTFFYQDQHNWEKFYEKTRVFLTSFESLNKVACFHKISEELLLIPARHVMLVLGKLWILYFPCPLKSCTYELLSIRENSIEKISVSYECYHETLHYHRGCFTLNC